MEGDFADETRACEVKLLIWWQPDLSVDRPREIVGAAREIGDFTFTFERFGPPREEESVTLKTGCRSGFPWANRHWVPGDLLWVRFLDAQGRRVPWSRSAGSGTSRDWSFTPERFDRIAAAEVHAYSDFFNLEIPFELRDIPLPRW